MRRTPHLLRDVLLLSLPVLGLAIYLWAAALTSFWNAEIRAFHGELVRDQRVGSLRRMIQAATGTVFRQEPREFLPIRRPVAPAPSTGAVGNPPGQGLLVFDLRIDGAAVDALEEDLPGSAREQQKALLSVEGRDLEVDATWRGQRMQNFFFARKAWKLRARKGEFVDGLRLLNLTPLEDRLASLATFAAFDAAGAAAPRTRLVRLYVNMEDQGIYLLEEQVDESMVRRIGRMPGDVFYGELFVPEVPVSSSWELFWNPWPWEKHDEWNRFPSEWRPWLTDLLDAVCARLPEGLDALQELLDPSFTRFFALLCFLGDQHLDHSHNHKLSFDLLAGRFEGIPWNPLVNMPAGQGVESTANRLFRRLAQDPRFLDRVQRVIHDELLEGGVMERVRGELDRIEGTLAEAGVLDDGWLGYAIRGMRRRLDEREATVRACFESAEAAFAQQIGRSGLRELSLLATSAASLRLTALELDGPAAGVALFEDRDFDGQLGEHDRRLATRADGSRLAIESPDALVHVGRDFTASYHRRPSEGQDTFQQHREFTRLAALASDYLLVGDDGSGRAAPAIARVELERTVGRGAVAVSEGAPQGFVATESVHPWTIPAPPAPRAIELSGVVELEESLLLSSRDSLAIAPGTRVRLGPGVSIQVRSRVDWRGVAFGRLDPARPFGVIALQDHGCDGSRLEDVTIEGGSDATVGHLYYSGMLSVHGVDDLVVSGCKFARNVIGDDTVRLGACRGVLFEDVRVEGAIGDALDFDLCQGVLRDTVVDRPGNDGVDLMTGRVDVQRLEVIGAGDKGISIGEGSHPEVADCVFRGCVTGIGIKDGSDPTIRDTLVEECRVAVSGYDKNWRYPGGGLGRLVRCTLRGNEVDVRLDAASTLALEECETDGKFELPRGAAPEALTILPAAVAAPEPRQ